MLRRVAQLRPGTLSCATRTLARPRAARALFTYDLPQSRIASHPADPRGSSKLLVYRDANVTDHTFADLDGFLPKDALVVANDSRVVRARLKCTHNGSSFEVLLLAPADDAADPATLVAAAAHGQTWCAMARTTDLAEGTRFTIEGSRASLRVERVTSPWIEHGEADGSEVDVVIEAEGTLDDLLKECGEVPIPPYFNREAEASDDDDYQTTYAGDQGSVAAPTAGLHFTREHWARVEHRFETARVTLHVGAGTFRPVTGAIDDHDMHSERFSVKRSTVEALVAAKNEGRAVVAIGTTSCRALESLYLLAARLTAISPCAQKGQDLKKNAAKGDLGSLPQWSGRSDRAPAQDVLANLLKESPAPGFTAATSLCITHDAKWQFSMIDALVTNFHHPDSTLLHLVDAFLAGKAADLYGKALAGDYRFLSYGDACYLAVSEGERAARRGIVGAGTTAKPQGAPQSSAAEAPSGKPKVLLHSCCAPCSGAMIEEMVEKRDADVTVFFYNPNIHPRAEYELRKRENETYAKRLGVPFIDGDYDPDEWYRRAKGMEFDPERGERCTMCFDLRMERAALYAHEWGFDAIGTTNATSRWKDENQVDDSGRRAAAKYPGLKYLDEDWKTDAMTERKYQINADNSFYKQEYCGCSFSLRDNNFHRAKEGQDPIKPAQGDIYSDPLADSAEESPAVVDAFFRDAPAFSEELRDVFKSRRKSRDASSGANNW